MNSAVAPESDFGVSQCVTKRAFHRHTTSLQHVRVEWSGSSRLRHFDVDYARVFLDGTLVIRHIKHHQMIVLEPSLSKGVVTWRCIGGPMSDIPPSCR